MVDAVPNPACPRCGYDQSGLIATWELSCPLLCTCPECGHDSPSASLFVSEMLGPSWSFEHASRRFIRKWISTTAISIRPTKLWKGLRPDQPIFRPRLVWMTLSWLLLLHLITAALVGLSTLLVMLCGPGPFGPWDWSLPRQWWFWRIVLRRLAWPYGGSIEFPLAPNMTSGDPAYMCAEMVAFPMLYMGAMACVSLQWPRLQRIGPRHVERALPLILPSIALWLIIECLAVGVISQLETPTSTSPWSWVIMLSLAGGYLAHMVWWWRCFAVYYAARPARTWLLPVFGILALIMGWATAAIID
jgi:hypothetical protein